MKKQISLLLSVIILLSVFALSSNAQNKSSKKKSAAVVSTPEAVKSDWAEYDAWENLLTNIYTSAKSGDLGPLQNHVAELSRLSIAVGKSQYPEVNDNVEFRTVLGEFSDLCEQMHNSVLAGKSAEDLSVEVDALQHSFSEISSMRDSQRKAKQ